MTMKQSASSTGPSSTGPSSTGTSSTGASSTGTPSTRAPSSGGPTPARRGAGSLTARVVGAALCVAVAYIHVKDQGGLPGDKTPEYVAIGYYLLEAVAVVTALLLLSGRARATSWFLATGVALGPIVGYVLSRGPGLPAYTDDKGNWSEPLGVVSLVVEGALLLLALAALAGARRRGRRPAPYDAYPGETPTPGMASSAGSTGRHGRR